MSFLLSQLSKFLGKQEMRCLMLGLDGTGKTSILYRLKHGKITESEIIPTVGFNCECIEYKRLIFSVWDVSGSADTRCFWRFYYKDTHALIFVVDSSDEVFLSLTPFFPYVTPHSSYITPFNFCHSSDEASFSLSPHSSHMSDPILPI